MSGGGGAIELVAGTIFAEDFRVVRLLSDGGMGSVYVVEQLSTGAERALKLMHGRLANDPTMRRRFETEARVGARIDSAHVVHVVAAGVDRETGAPWLAMELLAGEDLNEYSRRVGPLTLAEVGIIFEQLCHALGAAHAAGIVHRDLKPENVFLAKVSKAASSAPYEIKVLDFGIAKLTAELVGTDGGNTDTIGTPAWMAPEQTELGSTINPATDVWALGLIAFRLLTGKSFWRSSNVQGGNPDTLLREILYEMIPPATERAAEINRAQCLPKDFDLWFERCVIRAQQARFPDANIAWQTLSPVLSQTGALADTARWFKGGGAASNPPPPTRPSFASTPPPDRQPFTGPPPPPHYSGPSSIKPPPSFTPQPLPSSSSGGGSRGAVGLVIGAAVLLAVAGGAFAMRRYMLNEGLRAAPTAAMDASAFQPLPAASIEVDAAASPVLSDLVDHRATILIPGGTFQMGSNAGEDDERPVHPVTLQPFEIDTTEVTVAAYRACVNATRCSPAHAGEGCNANASLADRDSHPINCVDWNQASDYCRAHRKRLPTEEEWELAARGTKTSTHVWPWGTGAPGKQLCWNGEGNSEGKGKRASTCAVGTPEGDKSPYGVLGLAGNVSEWTASHYCPYPIASCPNPNRVVRGATWSDFAAASFRSTYRTRSLPNDANGSIGFRCARSP